MELRELKIKCGFIWARSALVSAWASCFLKSVVSCSLSRLRLYMILLIKDLDDPFDYSEKGESPGEVALFPIHEVKERLDNKLRKMGE